MSDLHILLSGPFVFRDDDDDCLQILVPDLLDSHYKPGFTATHNSAELDNGVFTITFDSERSSEKNAGRVEESHDFFDLDQPPYTEAATSGAYAILRLPACYEIFGISPISATITYPPQTGEIPKVEAGGLTHRRKGKPKDTNGLASRAIVEYKSVDLASIKITPTLNWHPTGGGLPQNPVVRAVGPVGLLVFDMQPLEVPAGPEHAMMAYRNMARMAGVDRYITVSEDVQAGFVLEHAKYNDCGAAMIMMYKPRKKYRRS